MNKKKEIQIIIDKYKSKELDIRSLSQRILNDRQYLLDHGNRTCKSSFDIIPKFPLATYGDGGIHILFSKILITDNYWDNLEWSEYSLNIEETIEDMLTMTYILSAIFNHKNDESKEVKTREERSLINVEPVQDFKVFSKYFLDFYREDVSKKMGLWTSYSHSKRYCDKIDNFLNELKNDK
jgi:hypothetical protein